MEIFLASPRGFCAGVDRAIDIVEKALILFGAPIYVRHEVVHNKFVVDGLRKKGAIFIEEVYEAPDKSTLIFSAHGVSQAVEMEAKQRDLNIFDATCPLVTKVHMEVARYSQRGQEVILIGHAGHPEVEGTMGRYDELYGGKIYLVEKFSDVDEIEVNNPMKLAFVSQTTLSVDDTRGIIDALRKRFPKISGPKKDDICYATQNRQDAVKRISQKVELLLVVGAPNSSNSNRLQELGVRAGVESHLITRASEITDQWLFGKTRIGITAGASAPDILVSEVIDHLKSKAIGGARVKDVLGVDETVSFAIPKSLRKRNVAQS